MITKFLLKIALIGGDPVLYLLIVMSIISIAIMIERFLTYRYIEKRIEIFKEIELRIALDKRLGILATFGNNAPFIGLFGTVLGVIKAFNDLGASSEFGVKVVMEGISQALVSTAMGLFVAIPSVIAYNYFVRKMKFFLLINENKGKIHERF